MGKLFETAKGIGKGQLENAGVINADAKTTDPEAYKELYEQALGSMAGVGQDAASKAQRGSLNSALQGQLDSLDNNAAGRKANFMEDQARGFAADTQNLARAKGGTGSLQQALSNSGQMYDSQARATSRGLNDLYSQATQDLGALGSTYGNLQGADQNRAAGIANTYQGELASRRGQMNQNADAEWNTNVQRQKAHGKTLEAVGSVAGVAASDINLKTEIAPTEDELLEFLDSLSSYRYLYKDPKFGKGEQYSVMAQDLQKSKVGKAMVVETPEGLFVDYGKGFGALLAAQVSLNERLRKLEALNG